MFAFNSARAGNNIAGGGTVFADGNDEINLMNTKWNFMCNGVWTHGNWLDSHYNTVADDGTYYYNIDIETKISFFGVNESDPAFQQLQSITQALDNADSLQERQAILSNGIELLESANMIQTADVIIKCIQVAYDESDLSNHPNGINGPCVDNAFAFDVANIEDLNLNYDYLFSIDLSGCYVNSLHDWWESFDGGLWLGCYDLSYGFGNSFVGTIVGGDDVSDPEFYHWLQLNAKQISNETEVSSDDTLFVAYKHEQTSTNDTLVGAQSACSGNSTAVLNELIDIDCVPNQEFTLKITCSNPYLSNNDIRLMHYTNNEWVEETISEATYIDGVLQIKSTFSSFSPIAILKTPKNMPTSGVVLDSVLYATLMLSVLAVTLVIFKNSQKKELSN